MSFFSLGYNIISPVTIMPVFVSYLTGSNVIIGLVPAIEPLAFALPQLFGARYYDIEVDFEGTANSSFCHSKYNVLRWGSSLLSRRSSRRAQPLLCTLQQ